MYAIVRIPPKRPLMISLSCGILLTIVKKIGPNAPGAARSRCRLSDLEDQLKDKTNAENYIAQGDERGIIFHAIVRLEADE